MTREQLEPHYNKYPNVLTLGNTFILGTVFLE